MTTICEALRASESPGSARTSRLIRRSGGGGRWRRCGRIEATGGPGDACARPADCRSLARSCSTAARAIWKTTKASQTRSQRRHRPGQADERREDHTGDRVRRADELQIGRRQAHALAVRDRAVQEHARRERRRDGGELGRDRGVAREQPRAPRASAPAVMDEASAAPVESFRSSARAFEPLFGLWEAGRPAPSGPRRRPRPATPTRRS